MTRWLTDDEFLIAAFCLIGLVAVFGLGIVIGIMANELARQFRSEDDADERAEDDRDLR